WTTKGFKPADKNVIGGVKEEHTKFGAVGAQLVHGFLKSLEEFLGPHIDHQRKLEWGVRVLSNQLRHGRKQLWRKIVDDIPSEVFQGVCCGGASSTRHAGDN